MSSPWSLDRELNALNSSQQASVLAPLRHTLVSAGAGTGKTRVLTLRFAYLVQEHLVDPTTVMAVTFTNKAAYELKHRLRQQLDCDLSSLWIGTFHSLGLRILRSHSSMIQRTPDFRVLDAHDQLTLINKIMKDLNIKSFQSGRSVLEKISHWKHNLWSPDQVKPPCDPMCLKIYHQYQAQLLLMNAVDFDDLIFYSRAVLLSLPRGHAYSFSYILVDEYQDINDMQYQWLRVCANEEAKVFCVGDDDQSIYGWRGARVDKILRFANDFPQSGIIYLEDNYRSTGPILHAATHLIAHNKERYGKVLRPHHPNGEKVTVQGLWDSREEAAFIADTVLKWQQNNRSLRSMAILVRTMAQTREFEERFALQNIPYHLIGNTRFYDRLEIRDVVSFLRVIHSPFDNLAFERIINTPKRGIGDSTLQHLYTLVLSHDGSLERAARAWRDDVKDGAVKRSLAGLLLMIDEWRCAASSLDLKNLAQKVLKESGYEAMWIAQGVQGEARLDNIKELLQGMAMHTSLADFLDHVSVLSQVDDDHRHEGVAIMTLHAAKGLEFDYVFLPGWEEGMFPHIRAIEESGKKGVEEERRLAYVGLTRARLVALISFSWNRRSHQGWMPASPSRFIQELPSEAVELSLKVHQRSSHASISEQQKVIHSVFGHGVVQSQQGSMVSVHFEKYGVKKLIDRFLQFV